MRRWVTVCLVAGLMVCPGCRRRPPARAASRPAAAVRPAPVWTPPTTRAVIPAETQAAPLTTPPAGVAPWPAFRGGPDQRGLAGGRLGEDFVQLWRFKTGGSVQSSPIVAEGKVFIGSEDGNVYAIDLATGAKAWSATTDEAVSAPPLYVGGRIYVGSQDNNLYCLSAARGRLIWKYPTEGAIHAAAGWMPDEKGPDGKILVGSYDFHLHCVRASDGRRMWRSRTENYINGCPAVAAGRCVFGGCDTFVYAIAPADGKPLAKVPSGSPEGFIAASVALVGPLAYIGNYEGRFVQVDLAAGRIDWAFERPKQPFFSCPAVTDTRVVVGCQTGQVYCLDRRTGAKVWEFAARGGVDGSPVVCDGKVVLGSDDGRLYVLRLADGRPLWSHDLGEGILSSPAVVDGKIIIGCNDGYVYAFGPTPSEKREEHE